MLLKKLNPQEIKIYDIGKFSVIPHICSAIDKVEFSDSIAQGPDINVRFLDLPISIDILDLPLRCCINKTIK